MSGKHIRAKSSKPVRPPAARRSRDVQPKNHDTYVRKAKSPGAFVCRECGVVQHAGRWFWGKPPVTDERSGLCPACERVRDRYPAGTIRIHPPLLEHREEILNAVAATEEAEKGEHPLERLMSIEEEGEVLVIKTTGIHLARRITGKLERRFHKRARVHYPEEQSLVFVDLGP